MSPSSSPAWRWSPGIVSASGSVSVRGNYFGTNSAWQDLGPDADSIIVSNAGPSAVISIGGSGAGDGNWICFADNPGRSAIQIEGTNLPTIEGNFIGTNASAADLGNFNGIYSVWTAQDARIGATNPAVDNSASNTIAFNDGWGIQFSGPGVDDIRFRGNLIHTNGLGAVSLDAGANAGLTAPDLLTVAATVVGMPPNCRP